MATNRYRISPKQKPKLSLSHLFRRTLDRKHHPNSTPNSPSSRSEAALTRSATVSWARSRADERFLNLLCGSRKGRTNSGDFKYDPFTYSLNFDEGSRSHHDEGDESDGVPVRSFSARLPASPQREVAESRVVAALAPAAVVAREISTLS